MDRVADPFMAEAIALAVENARSGRGGPFAALVVRDSVVIARAVNLVTSANDPTAHAEVLAIREACRILRDFRLTGCELYATCEPCPMCLGAIYWARPDRVLFAATSRDAADAGFDDHAIYGEIARPAERRVIPFVRHMRAEALAAFRAWRERTDRRTY
ncbi:MAG: nucleoside deaminase [Planctomycetes bacterium]|jgi:tRNA(Arg) A34 adenosine deaminase TadA|nr:nucleoside deaminase [Planctomycetota bacterium]